MPDSHLATGLIGVECPEKGGRAVYAATRFTRGQRLAVWGGAVIDAAELRARPLAERRLMLQVDEDAFLLSMDEGPADWINHSCEPNAGLSGQITLVALRDIDPGEEICFDYAMTDGCDYDEFPCRCGASACRGQVTGADWRRPDLIQRYAGYFSTYLQRRIDALAAREQARASGRR